MYREPEGYLGDPSGAPAKGPGMVNVNWLPEKRLIMQIKKIAISAAIVATLAMAGCAKKDDAAAPAADAAAAPAAPAADAAAAPAAPAADASAAAPAAAAPAAPAADAAAPASK